MDLTTSRARCHHQAERRSLAFLGDQLTWISFRKPSLSSIICRVVFFSAKCSFLALHSHKLNPSWANLWLLPCPLYIGNAVTVFLDVRSLSSVPLDDVPYVGQFIAVSVFERLYFWKCHHPGKGVVGGFDVCVWEGERSGSGGKGGSKVSQLVYTKSVFIKEVDRTGSVLFENRNIFLHQSHQSAASFKVTTDRWYQNRIFVGLLFLETKKQIFFIFFCMTKCRLFIGSCAR